MEEKRVLKNVFRTDYEVYIIDGESYYIREVGKIDDEFKLISRTTFQRFENVAD